MCAHSTGRMFVRFVLFISYLSSILYYIIHIKGVDTGNAARCIPTQSGPKHGFSRIHCLSLYERIFGLGEVSFERERFSAARSGHGSTSLC